jgi:N-methylhydantoinase A
MRHGVKEAQYDNRYVAPSPLVPRALRLGIAERTAWDGTVLVEPDRTDVVEAVRVFREAGVEAVAVSFLHSYANGATEQAVGAMLAELAPELYVSLSSELHPQARYYERTSTTAFNAYVGPIVSGYIERLLERLAGLGFGGRLLVMQSHGGIASPGVVVERGAAALLSGPAAGPTARAAHVGPHGFADCVTVDMGGTSFEAALVRGGSALVVPSIEIDGRTVALPAVDIHTIGAGGGSVAWIDRGGLLRVGPESAGARPGPACYGFGGRQPTCTDANLLLGYLNPGFFAGGDLELDVDAARDAITREVAAPLGLDITAAAAGIYDVVNVNMAAAIRKVSVNRGIDPRAVPLVVAGGSGPVHAAAIAAELGIPLVVIPRLAGFLCATGMLLSDLRHDYVRTYVSALDAVDLDRLAASADAMLADGRAALESDGVDPATMRFELSLDLRYAGQHREIPVPCSREEIRAADWAGVRARFDDLHELHYGHSLPEEPLELVNVRLVALSVTAKPALPSLEQATSGIDSAVKGRRRAYFRATDSFDDVVLYDGDRLRAGYRLSGPAIVEERTTTVVVPPGHDLLCDVHGSYLLGPSETLDALAPEGAERAVVLG